MYVTYPKQQQPTRSTHTVEQYLSPSRTGFIHQTIAKIFTHDVMSAPVLAKVMPRVYVKILSDMSYCGDIDLTVRLYRCVM